MNLMYIYIYITRALETDAGQELDAYMTVSQKVSVSGSIAVSKLPRDHRVAEVRANTSPFD